MSDPTTPNEQGPGTPNSGTTSLSALSVVAIKDGAAGHHPHHHSSQHGPRFTSQTTLDAERADRISRLAGLERVATVRQNSSGQLAPQQQYQGSYTTGNYAKEISTVGSASATGSIGGKTQTTSGWAEQSMDYDDNNDDKMSEDPDQDGDGVSSVGGYSDDVDKASLVGFGEGAGSTVSGPVSTANARMIAARNSYNAANPNMTPRVQATSGGSTPMSGVERPMSGAGSLDPKMMDGVTYDQGVVDTTVSTPPMSVDQNPYAGGRFSGAGTELAENMIRDRLDDRDPRTMTTPPPNQSGLGRFGFENN